MLKLFVFIGILTATVATLRAQTKVEVELTPQRAAVLTEVAEEQKITIPEAAGNRLGEALDEDYATRNRQRELRLMKQFQSLDETGKRNVERAAGLGR